MLGTYSHGGRDTFKRDVAAAHSSHPGRPPSPRQLRYMAPFIRPPSRETVESYPVEQLHPSVVVRTTTAVLHAALSAPHE